MTVLTAVHPGLVALSDDLLRSGKWQAWRAADPRLAGLASLAEAQELWRHHHAGSEEGYLAIAALAAVGSRRGGDDDDAAMAVVLLLEDGIGRLTDFLRDLCELDDVIAAVWEEVKCSAPNLAHRAPRFLIRRARTRLQSPAHGLVNRTQTVVLERLSGSLNTDADATGVGAKPLWSAGSAPAADEACTDLADLLQWAGSSGVLEQPEVDMVLELMAVSQDCSGNEEAQRLVGERHGLSTRTVRRRRSAVVDRLRAVTADYLTDVG